MVFSVLHFLWCLYKIYEIKFIKELVHYIRMNVLFICNQNLHRSKTAELLFKEQFHTKSAGLYNNPVTAKQLGWADVVMVMEDMQRSELAKRFPTLYLQKRILSLDIPDVYSFNDQRLVGLLKSRVEEALSLLV